MTAQSRSVVVIVAAGAYTVYKTAGGWYDIDGIGEHLPPDTLFGRSTIEELYDEAITKNRLSIFAPFRGEDGGGPAGVYDRKK